MTTDDAKRARIKAKVAASQARQKRTAPTTPSQRGPRRKPRENDRSLTPWLIVGGGVVAGLIAAALIPRGLGRRWGKRALAAAAVGSEVALTFGKQARDAAADAGREGLERLEDLGETVGESTAAIRDRAAQAGGAAVRQARDTGLSLAREAVKLAARVRG